MESLSTGGAAVSEALVEDRAAALLRTDDAAPVPLTRLYRDVVRQLGPVVSGPAQLRACLRERPNRFIVLDPPGETAYAAAWPDDVRRAYAAVLAATAFSPEPRVALAPAGPDGVAGSDAPLDAVVRRLDASVRSLAGAAAADPTVPAALAEAIGEAGALRAALRTRPDEPAGAAGGHAQDD